MISPARNICLLILLGVLAGQTLITAHTATHAAGEIADCEFCVASGDTTYFLESRSDHDFVAVDTGHLSVTHAQTGETRQVPSFRPRGPPSTD